MDIRESIIRNYDKLGETQAIILYVAKRNGKKDESDVSDGYAVFDKKDRKYYYIIPVDPRYIEDVSEIFSQLPDEDN